MSPQASQIDWSPIDSGNAVVAEPQTTKPAERTTPTSRSMLSRFQLRRSEAEEDPFLARSDDDDADNDLARDEVEIVESTRPRRVPRVAQPAAVQTAPAETAPTQTASVSSRRNKIPTRTAARTQPVVSAPADDGALPTVLVTANRPPGRIPVSQASIPATEVSLVEIRPAEGSATSETTDSAISDNSLTTEERAPVEILPAPEAGTAADGPALEPQGEFRTADPSRVGPVLPAPAEERHTGTMPVSLTGIEQEQNQTDLPAERTSDSVLPLPPSDGDAEVSPIADEAGFSEPTLSGPVLRAPDATELPVVALNGEPAGSAVDAQHPLAPRPIEHAIAPRLTSASRLGLAIGLLGLACAGIWRFSEWRRFRNAKRC